MSGGVKISEEEISRIIASAIVLQLEPEAREKLISKAIGDHLLTKKNSYSGGKTEIQEIVDRAASRAVERAFDELFSSEPYKTRILELARKELEATLEISFDHVKTIVRAAVESALKRRTEEATKTPR